MSKNLSLFPPFSPVVITNPAPAELHDLATLGDPDRAIACQAVLLNAWLGRFGELPTFVVGENGAYILFAVTPPGGTPLVGAGALYNIVTMSQQGASMDVEVDIIVASDIPGLSDAIIAGAQGFTATAADPASAIQSVNVHIRTQ